MDEREPMAWVYYFDGDKARPVLTRDKKDWVGKHPGWEEAPLYLAREWVGLEEADLANCDSEEVKAARYWESKLKEKNT